MGIEKINTVYFSLGSNLGSRFLNIKEAIFRLAERFDIEEISTVIETEPVGYKNQPRFFNCVVKGVTSCDVGEVFSFTKEIEQDMGRNHTFKNGPRLIDIDILLFNDDVVSRDGLEIPHPEMASRRFVLAPLCEISPDLVHPVLGKTAAELLRDLDNSNVIEVVP